MSDPDLLKQAWKASADDHALPDLETVRAGADQFYRRIRLRNAIEYAASVVVVICFSAYALFLPSPAARIGAAMVVLATLMVVWQLHRRVSAAPPPERAAAQPILVHQRAQLARQRDALVGIFTWYLLPFIPGLLVMTLGPTLEHGAVGLLHMPRLVWIRLILSVAVITGIWLLNQRGARLLQKKIDDIDALIGTNE
jgi:hypothetical protein